MLRHRRPPPSPGAVGDEHDALHLPDVVVAEDTDVGVGEGLLGLLELGVHGTPGLASVQRNMGVNRPQLHPVVMHLILRPLQTLPKPQVLDRRLTGRPASGGLEPLEWSN